MLLTNDARSSEGGQEVSTQRQPALCSTPSPPRWSQPPLPSSDASVAELLFSCIRGSVA